VRLIDRHKAALPSWLALNYEDPIALVKGDGRRVWDADGNEYLDFFGGIVTTSAGHNIPEVVDAIREQAGKILHTSTLYLIEPAIELAERIIELSPVPNAKVFFCCSGSEANETALLLSSVYRRSGQVLALRNSYHGRSFATVAISGNRGWSPSALSPLAVSYVNSAYKYRSPFRDLSDADYIRVCAEDLRNVIETTTSGPIACMIAEPIQGVGGYATPPDGFFGAMKEILDEYEVPFISDEVQTGWGRTGEHFWGIQAHGVEPDLMTFAKGIGNGITLGGVVARAEIMDSIVDATSISTFGGNPLSTTAALANLDYLLTNDLQTNCLKVGHHLMTRLHELADRHEVIGDVRGKGLLIGVELVHPDRSPNSEAAARLMEETRRHGLLIGKGGLYGNVIRFAPPMSLTMEEADEAITILTDSFAALA
jgi:4-aminobutyrate aminotransferase